MQVRRKFYSYRRNNSGPYWPQPALQVLIIQGNPDGIIWTMFFTLWYSNIDFSNKFSCHAERRIRYRVVTPNFIQSVKVIPFIQVWLESADVKYFFDRFFQFCCYFYEQFFRNNALVFLDRFTFSNIKRKKCLSKKLFLNLLYAVAF